MTTPRVVVIVLNWCGEKDTIACIESLERATYRNLSILLMDNASPDGSGERLHRRFPSHEYLQTGTNRGYAGGNNVGFERALANGADYVVVLNHDTVVDPDCIEHLVRAAEESGAALVAPKIVYFDAPDRTWYAGGDFLAARALGRHRGEDTLDNGVVHRAPITFATGCCFLLRADALRAVGGFDESYFAYVEDAELSLRLRLAGFDMVYEPRARVLHRIPTGKPRETPFQIRQRDRNRRRLARTHYGWRQRIIFGAWFYPTRAIHLARYAVRGAWPEARAILDGTIGSLDVDSSRPSDVRTRTQPDHPQA